MQDAQRAFMFQPESFEDAGAVEPEIHIGSSVFFKSSRTLRKCVPCLEPSSADRETAGGCGNSLPESLRPLSVWVRTADDLSDNMLRDVKPPQRILEPCETLAMDPKPQLSLLVPSPRKPDDQLSVPDDVPSFEQKFSSDPSDGPDVAEVEMEWESQKAKSARPSFHQWEVDPSRPKSASSPPDRYMHELHVQEIKGFLKDVTKRPELLNVKVIIKRCRQEAKQQQQQQYQQQSASLTEMREHSAPSAPPTAHSWPLSAFGSKHKKTT